MWLHIHAGIKVKPYSALLLLVPKHQATSIHNAVLIFIVLGQINTDILQL